MATAEWMNDWRVGVRVWVEREGAPVLGEGRAELLAAIGRERSITRAAKAAQMSYRRAWNLIQEINLAAGEPLVIATAGGQTGGGAQLTPHGQLVLDVYERVRADLVESAGGALRSTLTGHKSPNAIIHVAAAISLQEAVGQILAEFALAQPDTQVRVIYGATNELADHLFTGMPIDLFLSANRAEINRIKVERFLVPRTRRAIATNGLAIICDRTAMRTKSAKILQSKNITRVAIAVSDCPVGKYSKQFLELTGQYEALLPKVLYVDNSRAVIAAIKSGAAQAGVVFASDAERSGDLQVVYRVPKRQVAATYEAALVGREKPLAAAKSLLEFLTSATAARCLKRCGMTPVA